MRQTDTHAPPPRRNQHSLTAALVLAAALLSGCGGGDDYCDAVKEHQAELSDVASATTPGALLEALPVLRDLADDAPDDIRDDWKAVIDPLTELDEALDDAGIDAATFDGHQLPDGLSDEQTTRIRAAAAGIVAPAVITAFDSVQQQAKDVCHTPMSL